jgi:uncharacterized protein (TIGR02145 family)
MSTQLAVRAENFQPQRFAKIALAATLGIAMTFTLSCGLHGTTDATGTCGGKEYKTSDFECVGGELIGKCRGVNYYPDYQTCKDGKIEDISGSSSSVKSSSSSSTGNTPSSSSVKSSSSSSIGDTPSSSSVKSSSGGAVSSSSQGSDIVGDSFTDARDGKKYKTVTIGTQTWMAQNLDYFEEWVGPTRGNKCYNNKDENCEKYGRLYEWDDAIRLCPDGWHLPTTAEWNTLISFVGADAGTKLKSTSDWREGAGTDIYGFGALPGGVLIGEYGEINTNGYWWTATEDRASNSYEVRINNGNGVQVDWWWDNKTKQYSIRCVKGLSSSSSIAYGKVTDNRDNKEYKTVKIGTQTWMAENLNYAGTSGEVVGSCYNNKDANCEKYGRLYNWATAMDVAANYNTTKLNAPPGQHQGICPDGWHLPTGSEWNTLKSFVGGNVGKILKARSSEWGDGYGTNIYGFGALPGGALTSEYEQINTNGHWWTATEDRASNSYEVRINNVNDVQVDWWWDNKTSQYSVRCVED